MSGIAEVDFVGMNPNPFGPQPPSKISTDRLIPYAKISRTHSEAQIAQLAASMKEWGWTNPALADRMADCCRSD